MEGNIKAPANKWSPPSEQSASRDKNLIIKHGTIPFSHDHGLAQNDGKPVNFRLANQTEPGYFLHQKWDYFGSARA